MRRESKIFTLKNCQQICIQQESTKRAIYWKMARDCTESDGCTLYYNTISWP